MKVTSYLRIEQFSNRNICIGGVGKMFYQDGFPIEVSIELLKDRNIEVSIYHLSDELLKHGWTSKKVISTLKNELGKDIVLVENFCNSTYEEQREMIFQYLFGCSTDDVRNGNKEPINIMKQKIILT
jgi:hypothetical protein